MSLRTVFTAALVAAIIALAPTATILPPVMQTASAATTANPTTTDQKAVEGAATPADAAAGPESQAKPKPGDDSTEQSSSTVRQLAKMSAGWISTLGASAVSIWQTLTGSNPAYAGGPTFTWPAFFDAAVSLLIIIAATLVAWFVVRGLVRRLFVMLDRFAGGAGRLETGPAGIWTRRMTAGIAALLIDVAGVVVAGVIGAVVAGLITADQSAAATRGLLFVNAFFVVELLKVAVRTVFSAGYPALRPSPMSSTLAGWWSIRLRWLTGWVGYGTMVAVPILETGISSGIAGLVHLLVFVVAYVVCVVSLCRHRRTLTQCFINRAARTRAVVFGFLYRLAARVWLPLALIYLTVVFLLTQLPTPEALAFVIEASLETALALVVGWVICRIIDLLRTSASRLGGRAAGKMTQLQKQIDNYIPIFAFAAKLIVVVFIAGTLIGIWEIFDFAAWLNSPAGAHTLGAVLRVLFVLAIATVIWMAASALVEFRLSPHTRSGAPSARQQTLMALFRNVLAIVIITVTAMIALAQIGVEIGPLIAAAGILGLAIGFGAQTLVQDVIAGVFIQLENAMNVGDWVTAGSVSGTVVRLSIRSVALQDLNGVYHIVPFSAARIVSNYMREGTVSHGEYAIALGEDIDTAIACLREAFEALKEDPEQAPNIVGDMEIPGVSAMEDNCLRIRTLIPTIPGTQWGVGRAFNRLVKIHFDQADIEIPFPHQTLYFGNNARSKPAKPGGFQLAGGASPPADDS